MSDKYELKQLGVTTAIALESLASAIRTPGADIELVDHDLTEVGSRSLAAVVKETAQYLGLNVTIQQKGRSYYVTSNHYGYAVNKATGESKELTLEERRGLHEVNFR